MLRPNPQASELLYGLLVQTTHLSCWMQPPNAYKLVKNPCMYKDRPVKNHPRNPPSGRIQYEDSSAKGGRHTGRPGCPPAHLLALPGSWGTWQTAMAHSSGSIIVLMPSSSLFLAKVKAAGV